MSTCTWWICHVSLGFSPTCFPSGLASWGWWPGGSKGQLHHGHWSAQRYCQGSWEPLGSTTPREMFSHRFNSDPRRSAQSRRDWYPWDPGRGWRPWARENAGNSMDLRQTIDIDFWGISYHMTGQTHSWEIPEPNGGVSFSQPCLISGPIKIWRWPGSMELGPTIEILGFELNVGPVMPPQLSRDIWEVHTTHRRNPACRVFPHRLGELSSSSLFSTLERDVKRDHLRSPHRGWVCRFQWALWGILIFPPSFQSPLEAEEKEYFIDMFGLFLKTCRDGLLWPTAVTREREREMSRQLIFTSAQKLTHQRASIDSKTPSTWDETPDRQWQRPNTVCRSFHVPLGLSASWGHKYSRKDGEPLSPGPEGKSAQTRPWFFWCVPLMQLHDQTLAYLFLVGDGLTYSPAPRAWAQPSDAQFGTHALV